MDEVKIDPEFKALIPPLSTEEREGLEANIKRDGCLDPLRTWNGILLDGHNRHEICTRLGIPFECVPIELTDREEAADWIDRNSLGRRNLTQDQRLFLMSRIYNRRKKAPNDGGKGTPKATEGQNVPRSSAEVVAQEFGVSDRTVKRAAQKVALVEQHPEKLQAVIKGEVKLADAIREIKRAEIITKLEDVQAREVKQAQGVYDVIVVDPPWKMEKIERDERPNQSEFDYPTMTEAELQAMKIPCADDCHVWLWATHKHLPVAFRLLDTWGLKYVCCFTWHKPGGFQPIGLPQYNSEFILYARKGSPKFIDTKAFFTCFDAPRGKHSEKPEEFYEVVRRVTAGRRLDMFNRRAIEGFDGYGNEAA